jgi:hypothetical protein
MTLSGYTWHELPVYNTSVDGDTKYALSNGLIRRQLVGGYWDHGSYRGSRSVNCNVFPTDISDGSARGCNTAQLSWGDMD